MRERNYTIPINESFEQKDGCAVCRLYAALERGSLEYSLGAAMMEPDVRLEQNKYGFCPAHLGTLLTMGNRLGLGLILETRLQAVVKALETPEVPSLYSPGLPGTAQRACTALGLIAPAPGREGLLHVGKEVVVDCYVCRRVELFFKAYVSNILYLWETEPEFKALFLAQPEICLPHTTRLLQAAPVELGKKTAQAFARDLAAVVLPKAKDLSERTSRFCKSFDHRYTGQDMGDAKTAVEDAAKWLGVR